MIQLSAAGKRFGPKTLFENLDWLITARDRVGLVGANGTGKTTLLKALARLEPLDYGEISFSKGVTAGYLPQDGLRFPAARCWPSACRYSAICSPWNRRWNT